jgi:formylglycine-generating enzyme required for sulfatase activity
LQKYAWFHNNSRARAWPCGGLLPNDLGLFDMLGNVYEWSHGRRYDYRIVDPKADDLDNDKVEMVLEKEVRAIRGGSFDYPLEGVRAANREPDTPSNVSAGGGFRLARTEP